MKFLAIGSGRIAAAIVGVGAVLLALVASPVIAVESRADLLARPVAAAQPAAKVAQVTSQVAGLPVVIDPTLKGNVLKFGAKVTAWHAPGRNSTAKSDRLGGHLRISSPGIDLRPTSRDSRAAGGPRMMFDRVLPTKTVTKDGVVYFTVKLPKKIAQSLRGVPAKNLSQRISAVMWHDKDTNSSIAPYAVRQFAVAFARSTKAVAKSKKQSSKSTGASKRSAARFSPLANTATSATPAAPFAVFNGTPYDLTLSVTGLQCTSTNYIANEPWAAGVTAMWAQTAFLGTADNYNANPSSTATSSFTSVVNAASSDAIIGSSNGIVFIPDDTPGVAASVGIGTFGVAVGINLLSDGLKAAVLAAEQNGSQCLRAGSAWQINWTASSINVNQTAGNVNYWVPAYGSTEKLQGVGVSSLPVATGMGVTPFSGYNATSANNLAVAASVLQNELNASGSLVMAMLNEGVQQRNPNDLGDQPQTYVCNLSNQQQTNPNSSSSNTDYGVSFFNGGISADWSGCSGSEQPQYQNNGKPNPSGDNPYDMNVGVTVLIGFGNTAVTKGGPYAAATPTSASSVGLCVATAAPCITASVGVGSTGTSADSSVATGCTVGDWNFATPWNGNTYSLSNPPLDYSTQNSMATQLVYRGVSSSGSSLIYTLPGNVTSGAIQAGFSPVGTNLWSLTNSDLQLIQNTVPGGYVSQWGCLMSAYTSIPQGLESQAPTALNLGWNGTPVIAWVDNPAGNLTSPPSSGGGSGGSGGSGGAVTTIAPPTNVLALGGTGLVAAAWTPITATTTGIQAVSYVATASSGQSCTTAGTTCTINAVPNGVPVTVSVTAASGGLTSAASAPSAPTTASAAAVPPSPATPVQNVIANFGAGSAAVSWNAVVTAAGEIAAASYTARTSSGQSCTTTETTCVIVNVPAGTPVTVTVTTNTSNGSTTPSTPTAPVVMPANSPAPATPVPPAQLELDASAPTSVKADDDFKIKISVGPGSPDGVATVTLYKGGKTTATLGKVNVLNGKGENNLKIPKSTDKGSYSLRVSFTDNATDQIAKSSGAIKVT